MGVDVEWSGSTVGVPVGVCGARAVLVGWAVGLSAWGRVGVGASVALGSGLGLGVTMAVGVFVGVGVAVGVPEPHPMTNSAVAPTSATDHGKPFLVMVIWPSNSLGIATLWLGSGTTVAGIRPENQATLQNRGAKPDYTQRGRSGQQR